MPEGDSIHRLADRLAPVLVGQPLVRLEAPRADRLARRPPPGTLVAGVEAVGKHLLVRFGDGSILRTHLRMNGSWHLYRTGEVWRRPAHLMRALVEVPGWVAVCFAAPVVAIEHERGSDRGTSHLGPDLARAELADEEVDACVQRMAALVEPHEEIGVVLLDQRIACGVGNVFKSEVLWACRVDPFAPIARVDEPTRRDLIATAARLLQANARRSGPRVTHGDGVAVYGRQGRACPRCGSAIRVRRQGEQARSTYWCPHCQRGPVEEVAE